MYKKKLQIYKDKLINEETITDIIQHYYPHLLVENKIKHIGCTLWNKQKEIDSFLTSKPIHDINDLYQDYCITFKNKRKVSKTYFISYCASLQFSK